MVPELLLIIVLEMHGRIYYLHDLYDGPGLLIAFLPVFDGLEIVHHLLDISSIFRNIQSDSLSII